MQSKTHSIGQLSAQSPADIDADVTGLKSRRLTPMKSKNKIKTKDIDIIGYSFTNPPSFEEEARRTKLARRKFAAGAPPFVEYPFERKEETERRRKEYNAWWGLD